MFERFTQSARRVVVLAQEESRMLDHNHIGTEHILLGLIHEGDGVAARVIGSLGLTLEAARAEVEQMIGRGEEAPSGPIPFTPRAKKVLELSLREALALKNEYIGTEHILLGLIREGDGVGAQILAQVATPAAIRENAIARAQAEPPEPSADSLTDTTRAAGSAGFRRVSTGRPVRVSGATAQEFRDVLASIDRRLAAVERHLGLDGDQDEPEAAVPEDRPLPDDPPLP